VLLDGSTRPTAINPLRARANRPNACGLGLKHLLGQMPLPAAVLAPSESACHAVLCQMTGAGFTVARARGHATPEGLARSKRADSKHGHYSREAKTETVARAGGNASAPPSARLNLRPQLSDPISARIVS
jgi:hypothetical protein